MELERWCLKGILLLQCGTSSVGRASACQAEGRRFETGVPHHLTFYIYFFYTLTLVY